MLGTFIFVATLLAFGAAQTCQLQDNTDYDNGYTVMLYKIPSAQNCCAACSTFEECTYFSYIKEASAGVYYQRCFIKDSGTNKKVNNAVTAGTISRTPPPPPTCTVEDNTDYDNGWLSLITGVTSQQQCCDLCSNYPGCKYWTWLKDPAAGAWYQRCLFKSTNNGKKANTGVTSGSSTALALPQLRSGKRGLAWFNSKSCSDLKLMKGVSWIYNWGTQPDALVLPCLSQLGIEYIPMQWGGGGIATLNQTIYGNSQHLFAFNEPNFKSQANVSPQQAAQMWPTLEAISKQHGMKLGSPAAAACGPDPATECYAGSWDPKPWFDDFFKACTNCKVDFLTSHIYTCNMTELTAFINGLKRYNKPIWLTEFACPAAKQPDSVEMDFMKQALAFLDAEPLVERYAWFGTRLDPDDGWLGPQVDLLSDQSAALTNLGKFYTNQM